MSVAPATADTDTAGFSVRLDNFEGPFDLLLSLIAKHRLDITEIALAQVTDEFIGYIRAAGQDWELDRASQFLVVAATLLDLKTARLLPSGKVEDEEDLALLEARDLLFAHLLQYRAFKQVAAWIAAVLDGQSRLVARPGGLEQQFFDLLPEVELNITPEQLRRLTEQAMTPAEAAAISLEHLYQPVVSVVEQAHLVAAHLRRAHVLTWRGIIADAGAPAVVVARFLAILELYRSALVGFEQVSPLGDLLVRWTGGDGDVEINVADEFSDTVGVADQTGETVIAQR